MAKLEQIQTTPASGYKHRPHRDAVPMLTPGAQVELDFLTDAGWLSNPVGFALLSTGYTQEQLAAELNASQMNVSRWSRYPHQLRYGVYLRLLRFLAHWFKQYGEPSTTCDEGR